MTAWRAGNSSLEEFLAPTENHPDSLEERLLKTALMADRFSFGYFGLLAAVGGGS